MEETTKCTTCNSEIKRTANYCEYCGNKGAAGDHMDFKQVRNNRGQKIIFTGLVILCGSTIYHFLIGLFVKLTGNWRVYDTIEPFSLVIAFAAGCVALLIAIGLNSGVRKTLALIFASLYTLIHLYWIIDRLFPDKQPFEFLNF